MQISNIAIGGVSAAESQFDRAAYAVAHSATPTAPTSVQRPDLLDLSTLASSLMNARENYSANLASLRVADNMSKQTLNLLG